MLVLGAIEKIEISFRTQIIYNWAITYGSHWHLDASLFRNSVQFAKNYSKLHQEIDRSVETFIEHYKHNYTNPAEPPCWMSLEVTSYGLLSLMFSNLKLGKEKKLVIKHYGLNDVRVLENWMHSFSNIRNICAHHGRLWNRRFTTLIKVPTNPDYTFLDNTRILLYKIYVFKFFGCLLN